MTWEGLQCNFIMVTSHSPLAARYAFTIPLSVTWRKPINIRAYSVRLLVVLLPRQVAICLSLVRYILGMTVLYLGSNQFFFIISILSQRTKGQGDWLE
jgi:hypothetical protein